MLAVTISNTNPENLHEVLTTVVVPEIDKPNNDPCSELKKFNTNNAIQQTLRILKEQSSGQAEHGNYISETTNSVGATYLSFPVIPQNPNNPNQLDITAGLTTGKVKGAMHCHTNPATTGMIPMFSAADFAALYGIADAHVPANNAEKDYAEYTVILSVGSGHYALKFKSFDGNYAIFNEKFSDFEKNLKKDCKKLGATASSSQQIKTFLKNMNNSFVDAVGLYKATETTGSSGISNITGWKEQALDENGEVFEINCP